MTESIGEFDLKQTGNAYAENDEGVVVAYVNYDGTASGFGTVMGTLAFPLPDSGATSGSCTWTGQGFPPDSPWTTSTGKGTWEQIEGRYAWAVSMPALQISDGRAINCKGELDLETRTYTGKMYEVR